MGDTLFHRGPDDAQDVILGEAGFAFRRLAIVDQALGHQPFTNEDGHLLLMVNGEIYNAPELREGLLRRGHALKTRSDCEVIVHLYEEKGLGAISLLRGMFAFALYDSRKRTLTLARDMFGIKPLHYAAAPDGSLLFGSEVKSILASGRLPAEIDRSALWHYLTFQFAPLEMTLVRGVRRLPPGGYLQFSPAGMAVDRWVRPSFAPEENLDVDAWTEAFRSVMKDSVAAHTMADFPVGALLSSGIDSSYVAALLASFGPLHTFSVGFEGSHGAFDELGPARDVAAALGTQHHEVHVDAIRYVDAVRRLAFYQDDPVADPAAPGIHFVTEAARPFTKVVLSGEGADELFGGYPIYHEPFSLAPITGLPAPFRRSLSSIARHLPEGVAGRSYLLRGSLTLEERYIGGAKMFSEETKAALLPREAGDHVPSVSLTEPFYRKSEGLDPATRMQELDLAFWLPGDILAKADRMSMANSVELRVPFLDREVFRMARVLPLRAKISGSTTKVALRRAAEAYLPAGVSTRPKLGFPVPLRQWIAGPLHEVFHDTLRSSGGPDGLDPKAVTAVLEENDRGLDRARLLFTLFSLYLWHESMIVGAGRLQALAP